MIDSEDDKVTQQRASFRNNHDRNFITAGRAAKEFLLKPSQLEGLRKYIRRSPYANEVTIVVFTVKDVKERAIEVWGSLENMEREKKNREHYQNIIAQSNYEAKKSLKEARREGRNEKTTLMPSRNLCKDKDCLIIVVAITVDLLNVIFKLIVYLIIHSESVLAETIHSTADTLNQIILLIGVYQMAKKADSKHPYGYSNTLYVASLISGVGIFCLGSAVSVFHGILAVSSPYEDLIYKETIWAFLVLGFSFITESVSFCCTLATASKSARKMKIKLIRYIFRSNDPGIIAVLMEDFVALLGNIFACITLGISVYMENDLPDAIGCIIIGILLGIVALFLIVTNSNALVGRSISEERLENINKLLEADVMIRGLYDVKGIDIGNNLVRYKAELDFDGTELTRLYLDHINLNSLLQEVKKISNIDDLEMFMITHGENIVDLLGGEIDRIERNVRSNFPEVRHVDLEIV